MLRRRYDLGALLGSLGFGFFVLTGDAGWTATLVGSTSALDVLGLGSLDWSGGSWERVDTLGDVFVLAFWPRRRSTAPSTGGHARSSTSTRTRDTLGPSLASTRTRPSGSSMNWSGSSSAEAVK